MCRVAEQLSAGDQLVTHMRDELGLEDSSLARPLQAAFVSAASFASLALLVLGGLGGHLGGAPILRAAIRAVAGGSLAMAITAGIGHLLGLVAVG